MDRWTGVLNVALDSSGGSATFKIAASVLLTPTKSLAVPSVNAIFFTGDRASGFGRRDPVIERLSEARNIVDVLISKLAGRRANAWVVDAATYNGPFAVYREMVPSVNYRGEPESYDPEGFPAAKAVVEILSHCVKKMEESIPTAKLRAISEDESMRASSYSGHVPKTIILGFSKGGVVVNQLVVELGHLLLRLPLSPSLSTQNYIVPTYVEQLLSSISDFHYVDVGLNRTGAYTTDASAIKQIADMLVVSDRNLCFILHGTPRQWSDCQRLWIRKEKDALVRMLHKEAQRCEGRLQVTERYYFGTKSPSMQMHFEIIDAMDIN